ncbi:MAG TPA: YrdB family protein [Actinomycetes bacterium]|nr:YrdB family protein [Actinomycetes bacterium]
MKTANLGVRFLLELCLLAAWAVIGWHVSGHVVVRVLLAVLLPAVAATAWGLWVAPRATRRLDDPARFAVEAVLFVGAAVGLAVTGWPLWGGLLAAAYAVNVALGFAWHQRAH